MVDSRLCALLDMLEELENRVLVLERWENCAAFKLVTATLDRDGPEVLVSKQELAFTAVIELTETAAADVDIGTTGSSVCLRISVHELIGFLLGQQSSVANISCLEITIFIPWSKGVASFLDSINSH